MLYRTLKVEVTGIDRMVCLIVAVSDRDLSLMALIIAHHVGDVSEQSPAILLDGAWSSNTIIDKLQ